MRDKFIGYYPWTEDEFSDLWDKAIFVFDTNTLLNIYRYTEDTCERFLETLDAAIDRIWIPYQVGIEFHRNRRTCIANQLRAYDKLTARLKQFSKDFDAALGEYKNHRLISRERLNDELSKAITPVIESLKKSKSDHPDYLGDEDSVLDRLTTIFSGKVEDRFSEDELKKIYAEGKKRYAAKTPPGFKDKDKAEPARYGDLVIWKAMLEKGMKEKKPVIFVTSDTKDDWWLKEHGKRVGPLPELLQEFFDATGERCYIYTPMPFIERARAHFDLEAAGDDVLNEIKSVREETALPKYLTKGDSVASFTKKLSDFYHIPCATSSSTGGLGRAINVDQIQPSSSLWNTYLSSLNSLKSMMNGAGEYIFEDSEMGQLSRARAELRKKLEYYLEDIMDRIERLDEEIEQINKGEMCPPEDIYEMLHDADIRREELTDEFEKVRNTLRSVDEIDEC